VKSNSPVLVEIEYVHPCWCIETAEKNEGGKVVLLSTLYSTKTVEEGLFELEAEDVARFAASLSKNPHVRKLTVIQKTKSWALAKIAFDHDSLIVSKIMKTKSTPLSAMTKGDRDSVTVIVPSLRDLRALSSLMKDDTEFWLRSKKRLESNDALGLFNSKDFLNFKLVTERLPEKQRDAFTLASLKGYYSLPKKTSIADLAALADVSPSTFSENLRKAEGKLLNLFGSMLSRPPRF